MEMEGGTLGRLPPNFRTGCLGGKEQRRGGAARDFFRGRFAALSIPSAKKEWRKRGVSKWLMGNDVGAPLNKASAQEEKKGKNRQRPFSASSETILRKTGKGRQRSRRLKENCPIKP